MPFTTLISVSELAAQLGNPDWAIIDCRFLLTDPAAGRQKYLAGHIPGAVYAHLNEDLASPPIPGQTGKHPLPTVAQFAETLAKWGIDERVQVVIYDDAGGLIAGRVWWMLRWLGHEAAAVLDGDFRAWQANPQLPISNFQSGAETRTRRTFTPHPRPQMIAALAEVQANLHDPTRPMFDARAADRFRGENEPLYPVAGHIPGAHCAFYGANLTAEGRFQSPENLRARFVDLLGDTPSQDAIFYCGSGVSACHNLLALAIAGLPLGRLYVGSWSEWIADQQRPIAVGE